MMMMPCGSMSWVTRGESHQTNDIGHECYQQTFHKICKKTEADHIADDIETEEEAIEISQVVEDPDLNTESDNQSVLR